MSKKYVYNFGGGKADGDADMRNLLGGKGANLAEMGNLDIPVPPGFTITTEVCTYFYNHEKSYPGELEKEVEKGIKHIEKVMDAKFGDPSNPLLLSIRSGARVSMPGMMDTVLNLGLNDETIKGLIEKSNDECFAYDCYRRFVQMYADVVLGVESEKFENVIEEKKEAKGIKLDTEFSANDWKEMVDIFKKIVKEEGQSFPEDPWKQLWGGVGAVFGSWNTKRAINYRNINGIPHDWGTAVNVQAMVYGNLGNDSATGVAFTRDPSTGEHVFYGEFLRNAQGEDVVAGIRTPQPINEAGRTPETHEVLDESFPECYKELENIYKKLENHYKDMQDIEFTIQNDKLWMLQTRTGKRTAAAAVKIAVDMQDEGLISKKEAVLRVDPAQLDKLLHPMIDPEAEKDVMAKGLPASPGAAVGQVVFSAEDAEKWFEKGKKIILVRIETSPDDIHGMHVANGILTARGGMTSHAAVVARGMGKCCVAGCSALKVDYAGKKMTVAGKHELTEGDWITLDGSTGEVIKGQVGTIDPELKGEFGTIMEWVDEFRTLKVRTNADTSHDSEVALNFGAEGIGLCRTEHMFFEGSRIDLFREMIVAEDREGRKKALAKLLPVQKEDFKGIFKVMKGLPVTIRLLDPPLHEFIPHEDKDIKALADKIGIDSERLKEKVESLKEFNPMLGHRGCRLGITYPEIYAMQAQAIMEAVCELKKDEDVTSIPEIEIPLVAHVNELKQLRQVVDKVCQEVIGRTGVEVPYKIGTMIELVRAAITADQVAAQADFFSFGTNDLTQTTFGLSRDDAGRFLPEYVSKKILPTDPFIAIDREGVGEVMKIGVEKGRSVKKDLEIGICGEHGGEPTSVEFCHELELDYVSCSPYRVPIARLAAAHAAIKE